MATEEAELHYQQAKKRLELIQAFVRPEEIVSTWKKAADEMRQAGDYLDAGELAEEYERKAAQAETEGKERIYQKALGRLQKQVNDDAEYKLARESFQRLGDYKDSRELAVRCEEQISRVAKSNARKKNLALLALLLIAALGVGGIYYREKGLNQKWKAQTETESETEAETETENESETESETETDTETGSETEN